MSDFYQALEDAIANAVAAHIIEAEAYVTETKAPKPLKPRDPSESLRDRIIGQLGRDVSSNPHDHHPSPHEAFLLVEFAERYGIPLVRDGLTPYEEVALWRDKGSYAADVEDPTRSVSRQGAKARSLRLNVSRLWKSPKPGQQLNFGERLRVKRRKKPRGGMKFSELDSTDAMLMTERWRSDQHEVQMARLRRSGQGHRLRNGEHTMEIRMALARGFSRRWVASAFGIPSRDVPIQEGWGNRVTT